MLAKALTQLLPLLEASSEEQLSNAALVLWSQYQPLLKGLFLRVSFDGRYLEQLAQYPPTPESTQKGAQVRFNCADFDQPFSHVLFNGKGLCLYDLHNTANLDHPQYQAWLKGAPGNTQLSVEPVYLAGKIIGLWALQQSRTVSLQEKSADICALQTLVAQQLASLRKQQRAQNRHSDLLGEITTLHHNVQSNDQAQFLKSWIIGESESVKTLHRHIMVAARSTINVLVQGETGVGKDLVASAIHQLSARSKQAYIALNCAAIPSSLLESELFGYVKGAFSGANEQSTGLLGQADGGVFFLDEIGDMPLSIQAKLLRVIETRRYRPLGASVERESNFRLIAATHRDLPELIEQGEFRRDLYYRLNSYPIDVMPLRERREDIELLSKHFIACFNRENQRHISGIDSGVSLELSRRPFDGNIRQLKNLIDYACVHTYDDALIQEIEPLSKLLNTKKATDSRAILADESKNESSARPAIYHVALDKVDDFKQAVQTFEAHIIQHRLQSCHGNKTLAAQSLSVPRRTFTALYQRLANLCVSVQLDTAPEQKIESENTHQHQPVEITKS